MGWISITEHEAPGPIRAGDVVVHEDGETLMEIRLVYGAATGRRETAVCRWEDEGNGSAQECTYRTARLCKVG